MFSITCGTPLDPSCTHAQKRMLLSKSKEPRRTHWRTGALNHTIPRGSVWHNVETMGRSPLPVTTRSQSRLRYQNGVRLDDIRHGALRIFSCFLVADLANRSPGSGDPFHARTGHAFHKWIPATTPGLPHHRNFPPEQMRSKQRLRSKRQICKLFRRYRKQARHRRRYYVVAHRPARDFALTLPSNNGTAQNLLKSWTAEMGVTVRRYISASSAGVRGPAATERQEDVMQRMWGRPPGLPPSPSSARNFTSAGTASDLIAYDFLDTCIYGEQL